MLAQIRYYWLPIIATLFTIVITSCFSLGEYRFFDQKRIAQASVLVINSFFFLFFIYKNKLSGIDKKFKGAFILFFILLLISSLFSALSEWAFLEVGWYILLAELVVISAFSFTSDKQIFKYLLLVGLILLCILYSCRVYADYLIGIFREPWTTWPQQLSVRYYFDGKDITPNGFLGFGHVRFFNHLQTWSLPLLVFAYLYFKNKIIPGLRYLLLFFITSWWMLVFAADARGTMLASIVSLIVIVLLFKNKTISFLKIYGYTALVGLVLYLVLFLLPKEASREILTRFGDSGRWEVWQFSLEQISQNPWLGLGPMHFSYVGINPPWSTPHNLLLQSASEWGIPAVLFFIGLSIYAYYYFLKQSLELAVHEENLININWRIALIASITAALGHSMFSGIFNSQLSQLLGTLILGAAVGEYFLTSRKTLFQKRDSRSWPVYLIILILLANTSFVGVKILSDIPHLNERQKEYMEKYGSLTLYPRFWNQGMIYEKDNDIRNEGEGKYIEGQDE